MPQPEVHGQAPSGNAPDGENAGSAVEGTSGVGDPDVEDATVKEITSADGTRDNPSGDSPSGGSGTSPWIGIVEDLLKAGGKELWSVTKDYVKRGDLNLFSRRNPSASGGQEDGGAKSDAPKIPSPDHFKAVPEDDGDGQDGGSGQSGDEDSSRATSSPGQVEVPDPPGGADGSRLGADPSGGALTPGDLARVEVGNSILWVRVTGTATGQDDYEGRLAHAALGMSDGAPVTFARRHLVGRVTEAPDNPTPEVPEGLAGKRVRDNPGDGDGPLPPRF